MQHDSNNLRPSVRDEMTDNTPTSRFAAFFARLDWTMVFRFALIAVNVGAVIYALSKIALAYSIGGALYALVMGGQMSLFLVFFAAFAVVMVKRYDVKAIFSTAMALLCAFAI